MLPLGAKKKVELGVYDHQEKANLVGGDICWGEGRGCFQGPSNGTLEFWGLGEKKRKPPDSGKGEKSFH